MRKRPPGLINGAIFDAVHRDELRKEAWKTDQLDRDNWFDADLLAEAPRHLDFGNGAPIVVPREELYEVCLEVRDLVRFARKVVTKHFSSLAEVKAALRQFYACSDKEIQELPKSHLCAVIYSFAMSDLEHSVRIGRDPGLRMLDLAKGASRLTLLAQMDRSSSRMNHGDIREQLTKSILSERARNAANAMHSKPGKSRDKRAQIQAIWRSGKFKTKDLCAEEEYQALGMSFSTARKALRGL